MARFIRTSRQDIYIRLVRNAKAERGADEEAGESVQDSVDEDGDEYLFNYQYELFSFAAAQGYLQDEMIDEPDQWSQDIIRMSNMPPDSPHTTAIEFIAKLVEIEEDLDPEAAWELLLRYADAGVEQLNRELDVQEDFDMVRFVRDADGEAWFERLQDAMGTPDEIETRL